MQGLAPNLPFVVAWVGVETNLYTAVTHRLHNVTGVFDTWILLTTTQEEHIELLVKRLGIAQDARHFLLKVEIRGPTDAPEHTCRKDAYIGKHLRRAQADIERLSATRR